MALTDQSLRAAKRRLIEMHHRSRAGHLGGNLSCLDGMMLVHHELMQPEDRFILSKGHAAGAYYTTLWSQGQLSDADLDTFHRDDTLLAGHPPAFGIPAIRFATGSLGHGLSLAAGLALAARIKGKKHRIYCLTSDGEWQEGSTFEALIFAAHHKLSNLTILVDHNGLQGFGTTAAISSMDPLEDKLRSFAVDCRTCDGHSLWSMRQALIPTPDRPLLAILKTRKGHGIKELQDRVESHYLPLSDGQYHAALESLSQ